MNKGTLLLCLTLPLASCASGQPVELGAPSPDCYGEQCWKKYEDTSLGFHIGIPDVLSRWTTFSPSLDAEESYPSFTTPLDTSEETRLTVFTSPSPHCKNIGVGKPTVIEDVDRGIKTVQGEVDFFERFGSDYEPGTEPQCRPLGGGAAYALCSEKGDKQVLICISQVTDDPELATSILNTFQWTE